MFYRWIGWAALVLGQLVLNPVVGWAMDLEVRGHTVFATGGVSNEDLRKFEAAFASPAVDTVVLVNSPGGDLWTGLRVGRLIATKGYKTVVAGSCASACSIMFMGGTQRLFSDAFSPRQTYIGIHGAHDLLTKRINPQVQPSIYAFYKQKMGEKFNESVINQALYDMEDAGSMLRIADPVRAKNIAPLHCRSAQTPSDKCTKIPGVDALSLGIATVAELEKVDLPPTFLPALKLFGKDLTEPVLDMGAELAAFAPAYCPNEACQTAIPKLFGEAANHRALAVPAEGKGFAWVAKRDSIGLAATAALYQCNHRKAYPVRLCELQFVNDHLVRHFYAQAEQAHAEATKALRVPSEKTMPTRSLAVISPRFQVFDLKNF